MTTTTYYVFSTIDGFVAAEDDGLDWLVEVDPADRDFMPFVEGVGAMAMGSATYESVIHDQDLLAHPERWRQAHEGRPAWVFTHRELPKVEGADIRFVSGDVRPVHDAMREAAGGKDIFIVAGGALAAAFAEAGLLDRIVVAVVPVMLGGGKPLYSGRLSARQLTLTNVERVGQVANLTYDVRAAPQATRPQEAAAADSPT